MTDEKPRYWRVEPVLEFRQPPAQSAAYCMATGKLLDVAGGEGYYIGNEAMDSLLDHRGDHVLMPRSHYEEMRQQLEHDLEFLQWYYNQIHFHSELSGVMGSMKRIKDLLGK